MPGDFAQSGSGVVSPVVLTAAGEVPVEEKFNSTWISQNTTTTISANQLHSVVVNKGGVSGNAIQLFNGTVATNNVIGVIDTTVSGVGTRTYNCTVSGTITVVTLSGTCGDFTVNAI